MRLYFDLDYVDITDRMKLGFYTPNFLGYIYCLECFIINIMVEMYYWIVHSF